MPESFLSLKFLHFTLYYSDSPSKLSHAYAINEALQGKIRLLENRIARLQDEVETANLMSQNGMAIMMQQSKKKSNKPVRKSKDVFE